MKTYLFIQYSFLWAGENRVVGENCITCNMDSSACLVVDENVQMDNGGSEIDTSVLMADPEAKILLKGVTISR